MTKSHMGALKNPLSVWFNLMKTTLCRLLQRLPPRLDGRRGCLLKPSNSSPLQACLLPPPLWASNFPSKPSCTSLISPVSVLLTNLKITNIFNGKYYHSLMLRINLEKNTLVSSLKASMVHCWLQPMSIRPERKLPAGICLLPKVFYKLVNCGESILKWEGMEGSTSQWAEAGRLSAGSWLVPEAGLACFRYQGHLWWEPREGDSRNY